MQLLEVAQVAESTQSMQTWIDANANWLTVIGTVFALVQPPVSLMLRTRHRLKVVWVLTPLVMLLLAGTLSAKAPILLRVIAFFGLFAIAIALVIVMIVAVSKGKSRVLSCELFPDRPAIVQHGMQALEDATKTYDFIAATGYLVISQYQDLIRTKAKQGVRIRFMFSDPKKPCVEFDNAFKNTDGQVSGNVESAIQILANVVQHRLSKEEANNIELRVFSNVVPLYSMWIADLRLAHVQTFFYRGIAHSPAFRCADRKFCASAQEDFDELWNRPECQQIDLRTVPLRVSKVKS